MKYRAEVDGLRAIAVVPVILFHAGISTFGGGFVGVDVFFVISGYLITSIIITEMDDGLFSIAHFYERRARRILPALFFVIAVCYPVAWVVFLSADFYDFSASVLAVATFWSNIFFWQQSGYFAPAAELQPLLHTWSLAVEEQFYILFPLFLMLAWRWGRRAILAIMALGFVASLGLAQWGASNSPSTAFFLLPTRAWELLIGAFAAFYLFKREVQTPNWLNSLMSAAGLIAILYAVFFFDKNTPFPSVYALVPTVGTALVILFAQPKTPVYWLLSSKLLVWIGLISYSLYLWHQPIFVFARYSSFESSKLHIAAAIAATVIAALVSYTLVERPIRYKLFKKQIQVFTAAAFASLALIALSILGTSVEKPPRYQFAEYQEDREVLRAESWSILRNLTDDPTYTVINNAADRTLWFDENSDKRNLLVVGDSHSKDIFNLLIFSSVATQHFDLARFGVHVGNIGEQFYTSPNYIEADVILIASTYKDFGLTAIIGVTERIVADGKQLALVAQVFSFADNRRFTAADKLIIQCLKRLPCARDTLVTEVNTFFFHDFQDGLSTSKYSETVNLFSDLAQSRDAIVMLDRMEYICDTNSASCFAVDINLNKFFYDYGHHTIKGAEFFGGRVDQIDWLDPILQMAERTDM